ncbi:hypothetical protein Tco_1150895 [Tanacetum coccineum]
MVQMMTSLTHFKEFKSDEHASKDVWTKQFRPRLVLHLDVVWTKQFKPRSSSKDVWINQFKPRSLMSNLLASVP